MIKLPYIAYINFMSSSNKGVLFTMHELSCPSCNAPSQFDLKDYLLMCPFCSATFHIDHETGKKEVYSDHYVIPNACDSRQVKAIVMQWLKRLHHNAAQVEKEYFVTDLNGYSIPYWIISLEAHTSWKGLVKRQQRAFGDMSPGGGYIHESGQFRRNYRWAITARNNLFENWGLTRLHEPKEPIQIEWDGFPLDSTFSRGRIDPSLGVKTSREKADEELSAYDIREYFEFKFANGLPVLNIQVSEEEALRRAQSHVEQYHYELSKSYVDLLVDYRTELEIAGIQLIHLPFWHARYVYRPRSFLKHLKQTNQKNIILEGYAGGILKGELALIQKDKLWINAIITAIATIILFFIGMIWHPAFIFIAVFTLLVSIASIYKAATQSSSLHRGDNSGFFTAGSMGEDKEMEAS